MKEEKKESPIGVLWGWGKPYHGKFIGSIALAVLGVACQMVPYFCVAHIVTLMLSGDQNFSHYTAACVIALCGYLGKVIFSNLSTTISHTATYYTLRDLRENITEKLARVPMGTILDTPSGQYKTTIVDRVEGMEPTFAHLIPEMTANVLVPLVIIVYLFVMDWRMALLSLVTLVVGLAVMSAGMKNYPVKWEGAVKAGKQMANAIVEYIGGIEVVKAFSQSAGSYKKYSDAVNYNANYYVDWMRENQKTMSAYNAILPSVLICVLPCGFAFWLSGSLELSTFLSIVIFSLGLIGPIIAAFTFTDDLAVLGTNVEEISQLLNAEELNHKDTPVKLADTGISLRSVSFSYDGTTEVLHDVNLAIRPGTMTALVGPSGSGKSTVAKLIAGYWDVTSGSITLGGYELKDIPLSEISDQISYVSQDNYLFNRSIREHESLADFAEPLAVQLAHHQRQAYGNHHAQDDEDDVVQKRQLYNQRPGAGSKQEFEVVHPVPFALKQVVEEVLGRVHDLEVLKRHQDTEHREVAKTDVPNHGGERQNGQLRVSFCPSVPFLSARYSRFAHCITPPFFCRFLSKTRARNRSVSASRQSHPVCRFPQAFQ